MFNIFTNLILVGCSNDFGLNSSQVDPSVEDLTEDAPAEAVNTCECPDNSAEITALQEELRSILDRVGTLESEPEPVPEVPSSALVVTEYEVMCTAGRDSRGNLVLQDPYIFMGWGDPAVEVEGGCKVALIDPNDRPFIINIGTLWDYSLAGEASPYHAWETGPRFEPFHFDALDAGMLTRVSADGFVVSGAVISYSMQTHISSGEEETYIDLPVRVVIIDDKPALRPEAW
jgi:hypothetical protein